MSKVDTCTYYFPDQESFGLMIGSHLNHIKMDFKLLEDNLYENISDHYTINVQNESVVMQFFSRPFKGCWLEKELDLTKSSVELDVTVNEFEKEFYQRYKSENLLEYTFYYRDFYLSAIKVIDPLFYDRL